MDGQRIAEPGLLAQHGADVARVGLAAIALHRLGVERQPRDHGDAVIALLAVQRDVLIAEPLEALARKGVVDALDFLQAEHVGPHRLDELRHQVDAQPHRIDVPGGELELHVTPSRHPRRIFHDGGLSAIESLRLMRIQASKMAIAGSSPQDNDGSGKIATEFAACSRCGTCSGRAAAWSRGCRPRRWCPSPAGRSRSIAEAGSPARRTSASAGGCRR